jgi:hypothetical protein
LEVRNQEERESLIKVKLSSLSEAEIISAYEILEELLDESHDLALQMDESNFDKNFEEDYIDYSLGL